MAKEDYTLSLFMLQQTVAQSCTGLIQFFTGYYSGKLSLGKIIRLCSNFTTEADLLLPRDKPDDIRLFNLLLNSRARILQNIHTRHACDSRGQISVSKEEVHELFERAALFLESAERLCEGKRDPAWRNLF